MHKDDNNENDPFDELNDDKLFDVLDTFVNDSNPIKKTLQISNNICPSCKSKNLIFSMGKTSYICSDCGTKSEDILDDSPEWNNYEDGKVENCRCGAPTSAFFPISSLGTTINAPGYSKVKMLRNWGQMPYKEHSLSEILNDIENKCRKYKISKAIVDNAKILYKNVRDSKHDSGMNKGKNVIIRGLNRKQIIAACLYFGAILQKFPRSTKEVADIFTLELKQVTKGCRKFLEIMKDNFIIFDIKPSHGVDFIERFGNKLKISKQTIELAKLISENTTRLELASDHQATSIAAASILLALNILENENDNLDISKKQISEIFNISDVTITKTYKKIYPYKKIVTSTKITNRICHKINLKLMSNELENDIKNENDNHAATEVMPKVQETETEAVIRKLNISKQIEPTTTDIHESNIYTDQTIEIDETDVIKKDDILTKKDKLILHQQEKESRKLNKLKIKEVKLANKKKEKEERKKQKKEQKKVHKIIKQSSNDLNTQKRKRGRPRKQTNNIVINNVISN